MSGGAQYRETLHRWAAQHVPEGAKVVKVDIRYDDGWDPTYGEHSPSLDVVVTWQPSGGAARGASFDAEILTSLGELLTALFAIEDGTP